MRTAQTLSGIRPIPSEKAIAHGRPCTAYDTTSDSPAQTVVNTSSQRIVKRGISMGTILAYVGNQVQGLMFQVLERVFSGPFRIRSRTQFIPASGKVFLAIKKLGQTTRRSAVLISTVHFQQLASPHFRNLRRPEAVKQSIDECIGWIFRKPEFRWLTIYGDFKKYLICSAGSLWVGKEVFDMVMPT